MISKRFVRESALIGALAVSYFAAGKLGLSLALVNPSATAFWPPTGIALAAFLLFGFRVWPGILLGAFFVNVTTSGSMPASLSIAIGNTLEGLAGAFLVQQFANGRNVFDRARDVLAYAVLAGFLSTMLGATIGVTSLAMNGLAPWSDFGAIWITWWLGDVGGALVVAPVIVLWIARPGLRRDAGHGWELILLFVLIAVLSYAVFGGPLPRTSIVPREFILLPLIVWSAVRFGQRETALVTLLLSGIACWGTLAGQGPFAGLSANASLLVLQTFIGVMAILGVGLGAVVAERRGVEEAVSEANERLRRGLEELTDRNREMLLLNEMSDLLQSCLTTKEVYAIVHQTMTRVFPDESGALYVIDDSRSSVAAAITWGDIPLEHGFAPDCCWALRRGRIQLLSDEDRTLVCGHLPALAPPVTLCAPLIAHGEVLGILHLAGRSPETFKESKRRLCQAVADSVAIAVANLKVRDSLHEQSIRDPLTGLFNRRYLAESMERELFRATRNNSAIAAVLIDVDHFKLFNDSRGHLAGDFLLRELGGLLTRCIRKEDIACRYGGEEFLILLPDSSIETARQRAEKLRSWVKQLAIPDRDGSPSSISLSIGVAAFPHHGTTSTALLAAADAALYRAKHEGRDRVVLAESSPRRPEELSIARVKRTEVFDTAEERPRV